MNEYIEKKIYNKEFKIEYIKDRKGTEGIKIYIVDNNKFNKDELICSFYDNFSCGFKKEKIDNIEKEKDNLFYRLIINLITSFNGIKIYNIREIEKAEKIYKENFDYIKEIIINNLI